MLLLRKTRSVDFCNNRGAAKPCRCVLSTLGTSHEVIINVNVVISVSLVVAVYASTPCFEDHRILTVSILLPDTI